MLKRISLLSVISMFLYIFALSLSCSSSPGGPATSGNSSPNNTYNNALIGNWYACEYFTNGIFETNYGLTNTPVCWSFQSNGPFIVSNKSGVFFNFNNWSADETNIYTNGSPACPYSSTFLNLSGGKALLIGQYGEPLAGANAYYIILSNF